MCVRVCDLFRSDFDCAHEYDGPPGMEDTAIPLTGIKHKVAGCEWDINMFTENTGLVDPGTGVPDYLYPVEGEGPYIKLGTANGFW